MATLESIYERAKKAHSMCREGTLRISEAQQATEEMWFDLKSLYREDSVEWRKIDSASNKTAWWTAPGATGNFMKYFISNFAGQAMANKGIKIDSLPLAIYANR